MIYYASKFRPLKYFVEEKPKKKIRNWEKGRISLGFLFLFFIGFLLFFYLFETNGIATEAYKIKDYELRLKELEGQNQKLSIKIAQLKSPSLIKEKVADLNLEKVEIISYLTNQEGSLAKLR